MKFGMYPTRPIERLLDLALVLPRPLADTLLGSWLNHSVVTASRVGVFGALSDGALDVQEVAQRCETDIRATEKLLHALVGCGYLRVTGNRYELTKMSRRWLIPGEPDSLHDHMLLMELTERWLGSCENYVRTGVPLSVHEGLSERDWGLYQRGMRAIARISAPEVAWRTPAPRGARNMLDIGGSHGAYSAALCRRHRRLSSVVLDLPEAVREAAPLLEAEGLGERLRHWPGDLLTEDLGVERYDLIFISQLLHHFSESTNREIVRRAARALRPGGYLVVQEIERIDHPNAADQPGALADLYFALLSEAGTLSLEEIADWQREAGLVPRRPLRLLTLPGTGQQSARKAP